MITFLELLPIELHEITDYFEPNTELEENDHKVGVMSEDLKKLYTLWNNTMKTVSLMKTERRFSRVTNEEEFDAKIEELMERAEVLKNLFWFAVKVEYNLWGKDSIGVRKGFNVVWSDQEPGVDGLFRRLFEGL